MQNGRHVRVRYVTLFTPAVSQSGNWDRDQHDPVHNQSVALELGVAMTRRVAPTAQPGSSDSIGQRCDGFLDARCRDFRPAADFVDQE
jgi:hypothetical protein